MEMSTTTFPIGLVPQAPETVTADSPAVLVTPPSGVRIVEYVFLNQGGNVVYIVTENDVGISALTIPVGATEHTHLRVNPGSLVYLYATAPTAVLIQAFATVEGENETLLL